MTTRPPKVHTQLGRAAVQTTNGDKRGTDKRGTDGTSPSLGKSGNVSSVPGFVSASPSLPSLRKLASVPPA